MIELEDPQLLKEKMDKAQLELQFEQLSKLFDQFKQKVAEDHKNSSDETILLQMKEELTTERIEKQTLLAKVHQLEKELNLSQMKLAKLSNEIEEFRETELFFSESMDNFQNRIDAKDKQRISDLERLKKEMGDMNRKILLKAQDKMTKADVDFSQLQSQHNEDIEEIKRMEKVANQEREEKEKYSMEIKKLKEKISTMETEQTVLNSKLLQLQKMDTSLRSKISTYEKEIDDLNSEKSLSDPSAFQDVQAKLNLTVADLSVMKSERNAFEDRSKSLKEENEKLLVQVAELTKLASDLMELAEASKSKSEVEKSSVSNKKKRSDSDDYLNKERYELDGEEKEPKRPRQEEGAVN